MRGLVLIWLLLVGGALAGPSEEGLKAYESQAYARAAQSFREVLLESPRDPVAHYNLGLCYFELEDWGRARAAWETARTLRPHWNLPKRGLLQLGQSMKDGKRELAVKENPSHWLSLGQWWLLATLGYWLCIGALIVRYRYPKYHIQPLIFLGLLMVVLGGGAALTRHFEPERAVVVASKVLLKNGPGAEFSDSLSLHSGALVKVVSQRGSWLEVDVRGKVRGWLRGPQLQKLPKY